LAIARAAQKLKDELEKSALKPHEIPVRDFDLARNGNVVLIGTLQHSGSLIERVLDRVGCRVALTPEAAIIDNARVGPQLRLSNGLVQVVRDSAVVVKVKNPTDARSSLLVVAGMTGDAIERAIDAMSVRDVERLLAKRKYGAFLIDMNTQDGSIDVRDIADSAPLPSVGQGV
jgi:hypothetical protein